MIRKNPINQNNLLQGFTENRLMELVKNMSIGEAIIKLLAIGIAINFIDYLLRPTPKPVKQEPIILKIA
ncbi:MAG: hypothetical protein V4538_13940 [Bacteroidota bacterium]